MADFNNGIIKRVSYKEAKHAWEIGEKVMFLPVKCNVYYTGFNPWQMRDKRGNNYEYSEKFHTFIYVDTAEFGRDFDCYVRNFEDEYCDEFYGKYAKFFVEVKAS